MRKKVLIIEDEVRMSRLLKIYLEKECYQIEIDDNGAAGLDSALMNDFDLIIIDVMLPHKDGLMVLKELRRIKETPVMMISSLCGEYTQKQSIEMGANEYVLMPFSPRDVVTKIKHLLQYSFPIGNEPIIESFHHSVVDINSMDGVNHSFASTAFA